MRRPDRANPNSREMYANPALTGRRKRAGALWAMRRSQLVEGLARGVRCFLGRQPRIMWVNAVPSDGLPITPRGGIRLIAGSGGQTRQRGAWLLVSASVSVDGAPGAIRTPAPQIRSLAKIFLISEPYTIRSVTLKADATLGMRSVTCVTANALTAVQVSAAPSDSRRSPPSPLRGPKAWARYPVSVLP